MKSSRVSKQFCTSIAVCLSNWAAAACYTQPGPVDQVPADTEDGVFTSGFNPGMVDETATPDPHGFDGCIFNDNDNPGVVGFKFACEANLALQVDVTVTPSVGSPYVLNNSTADNSLEVDAITETLSPLIGACCADDTLPSNTCGTPHHAACVSDVIAHQCQLITGYINFLAAQALPSHRDAVKVLATATSPDICYSNNWGVGVGSNTCSFGEVCSADYCTDGTESSPFIFSHTHSMFVGSIEVAFDATGEIWLPNDAVQALPTTPEECVTPAFNDGAFSLWTEPATGSETRTSVGNVDLDIIGPSYAGEMIAGSGAFRASSFVETTEPGTDIQIEQWSLSSDTAAQVGTSSVESAAHAFHLALTESELATKSGSLYTIPAGGALFVAGAEVDDFGGYVMAYNTTDIDFYWISGGVGRCPTFSTRCLVNRAFTVEYVDAFDDEWVLDIASGTWKE